MLIACSWLVGQWPTLELVREKKGRENGGRRREGLGEGRRERKRGGKENRKREREIYPANS